MIKSRMIVVYLDRDGEECERSFDGTSRTEVAIDVSAFLCKLDYRLIRVEYWELQDVGEPPKEPRPLVWRGKP